MTSVVKYFRDHVELPYKEWKEYADMDMYIEQRSCYWQVDFNAADGAELNGHFYFTMYEDHYDTAKELINDMVDYDDCELLEAIQQFSESECQMLLKYIPRARIEAEYFVLSEGNIDG